MYFVLQIGAHATECILNFEERRQLFKLCTSMQFLTNVFLFISKDKIQFLCLSNRNFLLNYCTFHDSFKRKKKLISKWVYIKCLPLKIPVARWWSTLTITKHIFTKHCISVNYHRRMIGIDASIQQRNKILRNIVVLAAIITFNKEFIYNENILF